MSLRLAKYGVPSLMGACAAGLLASFLETSLHSRHALEAVVGAGFLLLFAIPIGLVASLVGRALVRAWDVPGLLKSLRDERGASPRFCAWLLYLLAAGAALWLGTFRGLLLLFSLTHVQSLVAMAAPVLVLALALALAALSHPLVALFETYLRRLEARRAEREQAALATPQAAMLAILAATVAALGASWWLWIAPAIGHLDVGFILYLLIFATGVIAFPVLWMRLGGHSLAQRGVGSILIFASLATIVCASWARYRRPYAMLEIWGSAPLAGWAIDSMYDMNSLRLGLPIEGIEPSAIAGAAHPNIVLITIDTVRADRVPLYGGNAKMPALRALGKEGMVFLHAYSPGNVTRRSLPTLATGLSPSRVRGRVAGWALRLDPRHVLLAERLRAGGYDTAGFFCCRSHFGRDHKLGLIRGLDHVEIEYDALPSAKNASEWLGNRKNDKPVFLWTHYIEPHNWQKDHKPGPSGRSKAARYKLSLEATDDALEVLIASVRERLGENTIIIVTADHGEGLGDHGIPHHSGSLYNSEIRVPLVIEGPGIKPGRFQPAVGLVDLAPTILELAGFEPPGMPQMDGLSMVPQLLGREDASFGLGEAYSQMVVDRSVAHNEWAVMSGRYKLIAKEGGKYELYDTIRDPREINDIKDMAALLFDSMKARLERRRAIDRVPPF